MYDKLKISVPIDENNKWIKEYNGDEKIAKLVEDFKKENDSEIPEHVIMKWKMGNKTLNLNDPIRTLLPHRSPTINLNVNYEQKGLDLNNNIINNSDLIGKPFNNPFEVQIYDKNKEKMNILHLNNNDIQNSEIENYSQSSAYCNGNNHLFISGGENEKNVILGHFWDIDLLNQTIKKNPKGIEPKKNHSMIFIPDKYVFIVGGNSKRTFYYDTENKEIFDWSNLNIERFEPSLMVVNDNLYCFDNIKKGNNELTFEKSNLIESPKWDLIKPKINPSINNFNQKFFGVSKLNNDNVIFLGGDMNDENNSIMNYSYNIPNETISKTQIPFFQKNLAEKTFIEIDENTDYILTDYPKNFPEILYFNKKKMKLTSVDFDIDKSNEKLQRPRKKNNKKYNFDMPERIRVNHNKENQIEKPITLENDDIDFIKQNEIKTKNKHQNKFEPEIPQNNENTEYYFEPINKNKKPIILKEEINNTENSEIKKSYKDKKIEPAMIIDNTNHSKINKSYLDYSYNGYLLRSSYIKNNKEGNIRSSKLPRVIRKSSPFKISKIGVAGEFDSKKFKKINQSVNVGISGKKIG